MTAFQKALLKAPEVPDLLICLNLFCLNLLRRHTKIPIVNKNESIEKMNPSDDQPGHAPIYSKKKKTATRGRKKETKRPGGVSTLDEPKGDVSKEENSKNDTTVPSSYAISSHGGKTDLGKGLALQARSEGSAQETTGKDNPSGGQDDSTEQDHSTSRDGDAAASDRAPKPIQRESGEHKESVEKGEEGEKGEGGENSKGREQRTMKEYSAEARTYHAYYEEVSTHNHPFFPSLLLTLQASTRSPPRASRVVP